MSLAPSITYKRYLRVRAKMKKHAVEIVREIQQSVLGVVNFAGLAFEDLGWIAGWYKLLGNRRHRGAQHTK